MNTMQYLIGINKIGNDSDFAKIRNYGFFYWLAMPQTPSGIRIKQILNDIMFNTLQTVTLPEWPLAYAEQRTYANLNIVQPVPAGIGSSNGLELSYLDVLTKPNDVTVLDMANEAFMRWQYEINLKLYNGLILSDIRPEMRTAVGCYVLLSPDLTEVWGGEVFGGLLLESYNPEYKYTAGQNELRKVTARFKFQERIPIYSVLQGQPLSNAFYDINVLDALTEAIAKARSIFTLAPA
ncbi:MAG: hypothetical protein F9Y92_06370 [Thermoplasmatales archaeon]|nr:hypothetical protein [Thermoplasmatales archaeon]